MGAVLSRLALPGASGDRLVKSLPFRALLSALLYAELGILVAWTVPSTFVVKRWYLLWLAKSKFIRSLAKTIPFALVILLWAWGRETFSEAVAATRTTVQAHHQAEVRRLRTGFALALLLFVQRAYQMTQANVDLIVRMDEEIVEKEIVNFRPPSVKTLDALTRAYQSVCDPVFLGLDNIPDERPLLFVANHTLMAFEFPLLLNALHKKKGIFVRALADHSHFQIPFNGAVLRNTFGAVDGTQRAADLLMRTKQCVFVYPGGARETFKRTTDEKYELFWKDHMGFAKLAIRHGCTVVPVVNVGTEDMAEVVYDFPLGWIPIPFLYGTDRTLPIMKPPSLNQLQRVYFAFGEPIRTAKYRGDTCEANLRAVRDAAQNQIKAGISQLDVLRQQDSHRFTSDRIPAVRSLANWIRRKAHDQGNTAQSAL